MPESETTTEKKEETEEKGENDKDKKSEESKPAESPKAPEKKSDGKVDTYAKKVGIIEPPPDIKVVVDRTADFVRRVGAAFEAEIVARNKKTKKFDFLKADNPYHPYYKHRLQHGDKVPLPPPEADAALTTGNVPTPADDKKGVKRKKGGLVIIPKDPTKKTQTLLEKMQAEIAKAKAVKPELVPKENPAPDKYSIKSPDMFQAVDIDIIKLTSLFVARNGRAFLAGLTKREQRNPQFDFLKPTHPLFTYFQRLVDAYAQIIIPPKPIIAKVKSWVVDPNSLLDEVLASAKFERDKKEQETRNEQDLEQERVAMALIDWHSFVVVETIHFLAEEEEFLPEPKTTIDDMNRMLQATTEGEELLSLQAAGGEDMDLEMDVDMELEADEEEKAAKEDDKDEDDEDEKKEEEKKEEEDDKKEEEIVPKSGVQYSLERKKAEEAASIQFQKCPNCGEMIPVDDIAEHVRIELLDPKWKERKVQMIEKQRKTSLATTLSISSNLSRLARKRTDVFIDKEEEEEERKDKEEEKKKHPDFLELVDPNKGKKPPVEEPDMDLEMDEDEEAQEIVQQRPPPPTPEVPPAKMSTPETHVPTPPTPHPPIAPPPTAPPPPPPQSVTTPTPPLPPQSLLPIPPSFPTGAIPPPPRPPTLAPPPLPVNPTLPGPPPTLPPPPTNIPVSAPAPPPFPFPPQPMPPFAGGPGMPPRMLVPIAAPAATKQKQQLNLIPEEEWMRRNPGPLTVKLAVPLLEQHKEWNFNGQTLDFIMDMKDTVLTLKKRISAALGKMPMKKMKISAGPVFLNKDKFSLAYYNLSNGVILTMGVRGRGKKK